MPLYFPTGLYRPFASIQGTDTLADILVPLLSLLGAAIFSAIPVYEVWGVWVAATYVFVAFHALCLLRRWVLRMWAYPTEQGLYISPSVWSLAEIEAILFPSFFWIGISFGVAYWLWEWTLR